MSAKGVLVNPILVAHDLIAQFDRMQTPEHTEGREGFIWVSGIEGNQSSATVELTIRDHDLARFEGRKRTIEAAVDHVRRLHPRASIDCQVTDVYGNIADALTPETMFAVDCLMAALDELGIEARPTAMRGGTDGSWLSRQGIPTPNFFTGAHNFHSVAELLPVSSLERSHAVVRELVRQVAKG